MAVRNGDDDETREGAQADEIIGPKPEGGPFSNLRYAAPKKIKVGRTRRHVFTPQHCIRRNGSRDPVCGRFCSGVADGYEVIE
jgi:hypothetical protein